MNHSNSSVILIIPSGSYRTNAFMNAVIKLDLKVLVITDKSQVFSEHYPENVITMNFQLWKDRLDIIREWSERYDLKAVIGVDEESIILAARLSESLCIEHNSLESVKITKDKYLMRRELKKFGLIGPWFKRFSVHKQPIDVFSEISLPCVIKPTFLSASQGVFRVNSLEEFVGGFEMLIDLLSQDEMKMLGGDKANWILVEEFIPGKEVSIEGIVNNGILKDLAIFDKPEPLDGPTFPETIFVTPTILDEHIQLSILETAQTALKALKIVKGPVHVELRINNNGNYILECAARSIGGLCSKILEFKGGMSLEELILCSSLGRNVEKTKLIERAKGVMMMPIEKRGILREIIGIEAALSVRGITDLQTTIRLNEILEPLPKGGRYLGFLFAEGKDQDMVKKVLKKAWSKIEVVYEKF